MRNRVIVTLVLLGLTGHAFGQGALEARPESGGPAVGMPLDTQSLKVVIDHQYAATTLRQVYRNELQARVEGTFRLSAPGGSRVVGFAYWNGETKIVGEVFEKETAREVYEQTTGLRRDPGLLEETGESSFSFRVFPIEPGERKRIEIAVGQRLSRTGSRVEYRFPLGNAVSDILLDLGDERPIRNVRSTTHALHVDRSRAGRFLIRAEAPAPVPELVVSYELVEAPFGVSAAVHRDAGQDAYVVIQMAAPAAAAGAVAAKDVTLVLDRSGSMSGEPIRQARRAAEAVVQRLGRDDRLNVIAFDDGVDALYPQPRTCTTAVVEEALAFIRRLQDQGGTNLGKALTKALEAQHQDRRPHLILFLTDGQSASKPIFTAARADRGDARVFTLGLGSGVNRPLLARLARMKRGTFTYVESAAALGDRVARLFTRLEAPVLLGVSVEAQGTPLMGIYPKTIPDLTRGEEMVVSARALKPGPATIIVRGTVGGKTVAFRKEIEIPKKVTRPWVGSLWAQSRVDDLREEIALAGETKELKDEVVELALAYNLVTPYTSFLAIPATELTSEARAQLASARDRKRAILAKHPDAAALSRRNMPPGDPILTVKAPRDARQVTAFFPFGLVKDLVYDDLYQAWRTRFLVPVAVPDGTYQTRVVIVLADGSSQTIAAEYTIDSAEPDFEVEVKPAAGGVTIRVTTAEHARAVTAALAASPGVRIELRVTDDPRVFEGFLPLGRGQHQLRVVVADLARNEADELVACRVEE